MRHNILTTSASKRVALVRAFHETLKRFFPKAKVYTADLNPDMAPAAYVSDECFQVSRITDPAYAETLLELCIRHEIGMIVPTIGGRCARRGQSGISS